MTINVEELQKMDHTDELRRQASLLKNPAFPSRCRMEVRLVFEENYSKWFVRKQWRVSGASPRCCVGTHAQEYKGMIECRASELYVPVLSMRSKMEVRSCCERPQQVVKRYGSISWTGIPWTRHRLPANDKRSRQESLTRRKLIVERGETDEDDGYRMSLCSWEVVRTAIRTQVSLQWALCRRTRRLCGTSCRKLRCIKNECSFRL